MTLRHAGGFTLIEVLVTMTVTSIGLLGLAGVQARAIQSEIEVYQRGQAILLLDDMSDRVALNRRARRCYETRMDGERYTLGTDSSTIPECVGFGDAETRDLARSDLAIWDSLLDGASEIQAGNQVGGLSRARGCIDYDVASDSVTISIAWQGEAPAIAPTQDCGRNAYGDDRFRRTISETIRFAELG